MQDILTSIQSSVIAFSNWIWGIPLLVLLLGGGIYLGLYSRFGYLKYFVYAWRLVLAKPAKTQENTAKISAFSALASAMANTVGMGNIAGVAIAIKIGGPGTIFWMWVTAIFGMGMELFTSTLAVMYRTNVNGEWRAGPMYIIMQGLGKKWKPLALLFAMAGMIGALPIFQANQLTKSIQDVMLQPMGIDNTFYSNLFISIVVVVLVAIVVLGGIKSISNTASKLVPTMVGVYFLSVFVILILNRENFVNNFLLIFQDAFSADFYKGDSVLGSALGGMIILGARRASFSNEAGLGTVSMFHGIAETSSPIKQGLVASLGPFIDTIVVCTLTGLAILSTNDWLSTDVTGVSLVFDIFRGSLHDVGTFAAFFCVFTFSITTLFTYSYLGSQCFGFVFGDKWSRYYNYFYILSIIIGSVSSMTFIISVIDGAFAVMAIPTVLATLLLSPKVMKMLKTFKASP